MCLGSKAVRHKSYYNLQSLPMLTHPWKDFFMDFVTGLPMSAHWKSDRYDSILVISDWLAKMVYYKAVKVTIDIPEIADVIIDMVVHYH